MRVSVIVEVEVEDPERIIEAAENGFPLRYGNGFDQYRATHTGHEPLGDALRFVLAVSLNAHDSNARHYGVSIPEPFDLVTGREKV